MANRNTPGLRKRGGIWHIQKHVNGEPLYESTGSADKDEAERYLARRLEEIRRASVYGERPRVTFDMAKEKYMKEDVPLKSRERAGYAFDVLLPFIGVLPLEEVHDGTLREYKSARTKEGMSVGTINKELAYVRRVLNLAARVWRHPSGLTFLSAPPLIQMVKGKARKPYPLAWTEQRALFGELPSHLERMALFMVNTGLRQGELCGLKWEWEVEVDVAGRAVSMFILPEDTTKNGEERLVVLNRIAESVLESERGNHPEYVFTYKGEPVQRMNNNAWRSARTRAQLKQVRVHDLRHTYGHRLRSALVSFEDRQDLLGHASGRMTTHYSAPDVERLYEASNLICTKRRSTILRAVGQKSGKMARKEMATTDVVTSR